MNKYTILLSSDSLKESLAEELNNLKNDDSVINKEDEISVITDYKEMTDFDVYVGIGDIAEETFMCLQENTKPALLCDIDCSKLEGVIATEEEEVNRRQAESNSQACLNIAEARRRKTIVNRWSSESRSQTCLDYAESRRRKTIVNPKAIPCTWGLFSRGNEDKERCFLKRFNLSFVYNEGADKVKDYIAPLVFRMLEEFSFHSKYSDNFAYKKQAEFVHEFTQFYLDKMKKLTEAEGFVREDIKGDFNHIIYRYRPGGAEKPFHSIDGRDYDFVIEYHRGKPSEGIYYGIKGEVASGNLEEQCEKFRKEWPNIFMMDKSDLQKIYDEICNESHDESRGKDIFWGYNFQLELTEILNNTFPWKDYLKCYKPTDNIWKNRYWLFWVTLNDDEDIVKVAARAVKLMAKTFERCMIIKEQDRLYEAPDNKPNECDTNQRTNFTEESYERFVKKMGYDDSGKSYGKRLIDKLIKEGYVFEDVRYEKCYRCIKNNRTIKKILNDINKGKEQSQILFPRCKSNDRRIPWGDIEGVLLPKSLNPSKGSFENG